MKLLCRFAITLFVLVVMHKTAHATVLGKPVVNKSTGSTYYLLEASSWTASELEAVSLGGHLVTINDAAENDWVSQTFGTKRNLWIGFYQPPGSPEPAGGWRWISGQPVTYINWNPNEPNNGFGPEGYAMMWGDPQDIRLEPNRRQAGTWNDFIDSGLHPNISLPFGVVEVEPSATGGQLATAAVAEPAGYGAVCFGTNLDNVPQVINVDIYDWRGNNVTSGSSCGVPQGPGITCQSTAAFSDSALRCVVRTSGSATKLRGSIVTYLGSFNNPGPANTTLAAQ